MAGTWVLEEMRESQDASKSRVSKQTNLDRILEEKRQKFFLKNPKKNSEIFFVNPAQEQIGNSNSTAFPLHNFPNHQI